MKKLSRGFMPKCPLFKPVAGGQRECLAERGGFRFIVTQYPKSGRLVAWRVANRGHAITKTRLPISTPQTRSISHLLDEAAAYVRRHDKPRA